MVPSVLLKSRVPENSQYAGIRLPNQNHSQYG
jgi:hypothetical protein